MTLFQNIQNSKYNKIFLSFLLFLLFLLFVEWTLRITMIGGTYFDFYSYGKITKIIRPLLFLILLGKFVEEKKYVFVFCLLILFLLCTVSHAHSKTWMLFDLFLLPFFIIKFYSVRNSYNFLFYSLVVFFVCISCLDLLGLSPRIEYSREYKGIFVSREALGFGHPNTVGYLLMIISMLYVLKKTVVNKFDVIILLGISAFCFFVPNSITSSFIVFLLGVFCFFYKDSSAVKHNSPLSKKVFCIIFSGLCLFIVFIWFIALTGSFQNILTSLSDTLWARFSLGNQGYYTYGVKIFGQTIDFLPEHGGFPIDSTYFYTPIVNGLIPFLVFILFYSLAVTIGICAHNLKFFVILFLCLLYGISEYIGGSLFIFLFLPLADYFVNKQIDIKEDY